MSRDLAPLDPNEQQGLSRLPFAASEDRPLWRGSYRLPLVQLLATSRR